MSNQTGLPFFLVLGVLQAGCGDKGVETNAGWYADDDGDDYESDQDCNDDNPAVNPGATEDCANTIDDDCDGLVDGDDVEDCPAEVGGGTTEGVGTNGAVGARPAGLDWSQLAWCAPEQTPAGLRNYRRSVHPFIVDRSST